MPVGISQFKEQDTVKERARKLNDIARLEDNRLSKLERDPSKVDFEDRLGALEDDIVAIEKSINLIIIGPSPLALLINGTRNMIAPLPLDDGAVAAPGLAFAADMNTGMYRIGADNIGFSTNGVLRVGIENGNLDVDVPIYALDGAVGGPAYSFDTDATTGIYMIAAGQMGIAITGALDFSFTANLFNVLAGSGIRMEDDTWIGSSFATSRIEFDTTPGPDEFRFIGANLDMNGNDVILDPDGDTLIHQGALDDQIDFYVGGATVAGIYNDVTASQILAMDGAFGNPAYSFLTDRTKGMEGSVAGTLRWSIGGVTEMWLNATTLTLPSNVFHGPDGAVGAPTYSFTSDPDTGIYWTATQLNFAVSGALDFSMAANAFTCADGSSIFLQEGINFTGATTENQIMFPDALANALSFQEGANLYLTFDTTNGAENIAFGQRLLIPSGAVGAPGWAFSADPDVGAYYTATQINWAVAGAQAAYLDATRFSSAGEINVPTGGHYEFNGVDVISIDGTNNLMMGVNAGNGGVSSQGVHIGYHAGNSTLAAGTHAVNIGNQAGEDQTTAVGCINIGAAAGANNIVGDNNLNIGYLSGTNMISTGNVGVGAQTNQLQNNVAAVFNTAVGFAALHDNLAGVHNTGVGAMALENATSSYNVGVGYQALDTLTSGRNNVGVGRGVLFSNSTSNFNVAVGDLALYTTTGASNVALGTNAGYAETGSSKLYIWNTTTAVLATDRIRALVYGEFAAAAANQLFRVNAECELYQDSLYWKWGGAGNCGIMFNGTDMITDFDILNAGTTDYRIQENGTDRFVILTGGNVGIGTSTPANGLEIAVNGVPITLNSTNSNSLKLAFEDAGAVTGYLGSSATYDLMIADNLAAILMTVDANGLIPSNNTTIHAIAQNGAPTTTTEGALWLDTNASANGTLMCYGNGAWRAVQALP